MKDFDLEAAKRGAAVCTRSGRKVRILCYDKKGESPIVAVVDFENHENQYEYDENGTSPYLTQQWLTLVMRDDDYLEKLERGEYGNHIVDVNEMVVPAVKENLTTDREYWRRVYAGQAITSVLYGLIINKYNGKMPVPEICARGSVDIADALIEELEKTEK